MDQTLLHIAIEDYNYSLPPDRIASFPLEKRDASKLLVYRNGHIADDHFFNLSRHISNASLVLNDTRVIEARIFFKKPTGGVIEIFCLGPYQQSIESSLQQKQSVRWLCLIGGASKWKPGQVLEKYISLSNEQVSLTATYIERKDDSFVIEFSWSPGQIAFGAIIHAAGNIPLPPYIKRETTEWDADRYQTVFGRKEGSVAAPTAALHFTPEVFASLERKNVQARFITLHVGAGTFKPVKAATIGGHQMHQEPFSARASTVRSLVESPYIIAVGTTSLRTLESLYWCGVKLLAGNTEGFREIWQWEAYELEEKYGSITAAESFQALLDWMGSRQLEEIHCVTSLIILPGYRFRITQGLVTNFHQPQSTLLLLVSAFVGEDWKRIYRHAMEQDYRFLSYGDSSLLLKG